MERLSSVLYIAGPITGIEGYQTNFMQGCGEVLAMGCVPVNPVEVCAAFDGLTWEQYMKMDIKALLECDGVYMLRGWENSRGARLEHLIAEGLGMRVVYQPEEGQ